MTEETIQAESLPEGWVWHRSDDGSARLQSPVEGVSFFSVDPQAGTVESLAGWARVAPDERRRILEGDFGGFEQSIKTARLDDAAKLAGRSFVCFGPFGDKTWPTGRGWEYVAVSPKLAVTTQGFWNVWQNMTTAALDVNRDAPVSPSEVASAIAKAVKRPVTKSARNIARGVAGGGSMRFEGKKISLSPVLYTSVDPATIGSDGHSYGSKKELEQAERQYAERGVTFSLDANGQWHGEGVEKDALQATAAVDVGGRDKGSMKSWGKPERAPASAAADPKADQRLAQESARVQGRTAQVRVQDQARGRQ